jgi:hypothetical protein
MTRAAAAAAAWNTIFYFCHFLEIIPSPFSLFFSCVFFFFFFIDQLGGRRPRKKLGSFSCASSLKTCFTTKEQARQLGEKLTLFL